MAYNWPMLTERAREVMARCPEYKLSQVCDTMGVSRHTLERALRAVTGTSFRELRQQLAKDRAIDLLSREPTAPLKQIRDRLGFSSDRSLIRFLKKATGKTSKALRGAHVSSPGPFAPLMSKNRPRRCNQRS